MVSQTERDIRLAELKDFIKQEQLSAVIILGNGSFGPKENGHYRFFVDNRVYYFIQAMVMDAAGEPVVICGSPTHQEVLRTRNFRNIRFAGDRIAHVIADVLTDKSISGTVGICEDQIPAAWFRMLEEKFPQIRFRDVSQQLYTLRRANDSERVRLAAKAAGLAQKGYSALLACLQEHASLDPLRARMEYAMKTEGAEEVFTLFSQPAPEGQLPLPADSDISGLRALCITAAPRYDGYWAPIARTVSLIGREDPRQRQIGQDVLAIGAGKLVPGAKISEAAEEMDLALLSRGCRKNDAYGNVCGLDLYEFPVAAGSEEVLSEGMTVFLRAEVIDADMQAGFLWGDTYLVTREGGKRLGIENIQSEGGDDR